MNGWLIVALVMVGIGIVLVVISAIFTISNINKSSTVMTSSVQRIQKQLEGVQNQSNALKGKVDHLSVDLNDKAMKMQSVVNSVVGLTNSITDLNQNANQKIALISKKVEESEKMQIEIDQWTKTVMTIGEKIRKR